MVRLEPKFALCLFSMGGKRLASQRIVVGENMMCVYVKFHICGILAHFISPDFPAVSSDFLLGTSWLLCLEFFLHLYGEVTHRTVCASSARCVLHKFYRAAREVVNQEVQFHHFSSHFSLQVRSKVFQGVQNINNIHLLAITMASIILLDVLLSFIR